MKDFKGEPMSEEARAVAKAFTDQIERDYRVARESTGIPEGYLRSRLLYVPAADTLIAEVYRGSDGWHTHRLFARRSTEIRYTAIGTPAEGVFYSQPVALPQAECAYFSVWRTADGGAGYDWDSIQRLHLSDYRIEQVVASDGLVVATPYERSWVSELLGVTADGASLICTCVLQRPTSTGGKMDYVVCYLDLATKQVTPLSKLEGIWY